MEKPDFVTNFVKPTGTEIKHIGKHWYLYERTSVYDPKIKRSRKKSGSILGKITPEGLVPSKRAAQPQSIHIDDVAEVATPVFFWDRTREIRSKLIEYFPDIWEWIYVAAFLRLYDPNFKRLEYHYEHSFLAYMFPGLRFDSRNNGLKLDDIGKRRDTIANFMKFELKNGSKYIIIDGHRLITSSQNLELAEKGYDSKQRYQPQTNILYAFSSDEKGIGLPSYYKQFIGSTLDMKAFINFIDETGIKREFFIIIGDKGFSCSEDFEMLEDFDLKYVIPLKRGNSLTKGNIPDTNYKYDNAFMFNNRPIMYKIIKDDNFKVITYYDTSLYNDELHTLLNKYENEQKKIKKLIEKEEKCRLKGTGALSDEDFEMLKSQQRSFSDVLAEKHEMGTITLRTNLNDVPEYIYRLYKQRQLIEQFFKTYVCGLEFDSSYMRTRTRQEAWCFLNHITAIIAIDLLNYISDLELTSTYSLEDIRKIFVHITANRINNEWKLAHIKKKTQALISALEFNLTDDILNDILVECDKERNNANNLKNYKISNNNKNNLSCDIIKKDNSLEEIAPEDEQKKTMLEEEHSEKTSKKTKISAEAEDSQTGDAPRKAQSGAVTQEARTEDTSRKPPSDVMAQARSEDTSRKPSPDVMAQARTEDTSRKTSSDVMAQEARSGTTASERSRTCKFSGGQHT